MVDIKPNWLQETAKRRWEYLVAEDLKKHKEFHKRRNWPRNLTRAELDMIEKAADVIGVNQAIGIIEGNMVSIGFVPPIPPDTKIGIIPFISNPQVKEVKTKEEDLDYVLKYDLDFADNSREVFSRFTYKEENKPAGYTLGVNERLAKINDDNSLQVEVPEKQIVDIVIFEPELEIKDESSYTIYLLRQQTGKSEFNLDIVSIGPNVIETYEQFKQNVMKTISADYLRIIKNKHDLSYVKIELTNLCSFVEKYLTNEPLSSPKRHLIELLKNIKVELVSHKSFFWDRIQKYVETPDANIPPAPYLTPEIQYWLQRVRDHIAFRYAPYLQKDPITNIYPMCPNITLYLSDVEAIIADLEILLRDIYYKWINNSRLFTGKLYTQIYSDLSSSKDGVSGSHTKKDRSFQKFHEMDFIPDQPLKTSQADNLNAWDRQKAMIFRQSKKDTINENLKFDNTVINSKDQQNLKKGEKRTVSKDIELDGRKMEWLERVVKLFLIYKDIGEILDKHFYSGITVLPRYDEEELDY